MPAYIALAHQEPGNDYGVIFPDFPGCVTMGSTLDEARAMAEEALDLHIEGMLEDGEPLPEPSSLQAVMAQAENRDAVAFLVEVTNERLKRRHVSVVFPEATLRLIDDFVRDHGLTRSLFLEQAARKALSQA